MRELELFDQYLFRLRQERLQASHAAAITATTLPDLLDIRGKACEAELTERVRSALKELNTDPGAFIKKYLT